MVTTSSIGSGKKVNVGQSFASGMSALQTVQKEKFVIVDESGEKKDAERLSLFKLKDTDKTYIVYTFNETDENDMIKLYKLYGKEWQRCKADNMGETVLRDIGRRQQLCIEAALLCLMKLKLARAEVKKKLNEFENIGCYPYKFMTWNLVGKGTVHPLKNRVLTFLFPIKGYYLLLCGLYRLIQR